MAVSGNRLSRERFVYFGTVYELLETDDLTVPHFENMGKAGAERFARCLVCAAVSAGPRDMLAFDDNRVIWHD